MSAPASSGRNMVKVLIMSYFYMRGEGGGVRGEGKGRGERGERGRRGRGRVKGYGNGV